MESARRHFLKIAGISALGFGTKPVLDAFAAGEGQEEKTSAKFAKGENALTAKHWGMVIDSRKFESAEDLEPIVEACRKIHNIPTHEDKNPPCVRACPTKATFKREDGIVLMDFHRCIGCRFCMAACPYGSRSFNFQDPRPFISEEYYNKEFPTRMKGVVEKCNFCAERLAAGKMPACAEASGGAVVFGDLYDPESEIRELLRTNYTIQRKQGLGTNPAIYYIV